MSEKLNRYKDYLKMLWKFTRWARDDGAHIPETAVELWSDDDFGYLYILDGVQYIVIDGSSTLREWFENFLFMLWGKARSMVGFDNAGKEFFEQLLKLLRKDLPIVLVGHSRGGAIVQTIAPRLAEGNLFDVLEVVTFGSPKVGGKSFRAWCNSLGINHVRVELSGDPVCRLAPWLKHYDTELIYIEHNLERKGLENKRKIHSAYGAFL